jgi:hypothetical protein
MSETRSEQISENRLGIPPSFSVHLCQVMFDEYLLVREHKRGEL